MYLKSVKDLLGFLLLFFQKVFPSTSFQIFNKSFFFFFFENLAVKKNNSDSFSSGFFGLALLEKHLESKHSHRGGNEGIPEGSAEALLPTLCLKFLFWLQRFFSFGLFIFVYLRSTGSTFDPEETEPLKPSLT